MSSADYPTEERPEVAFVGRSNVGKSSLMNKLLNRKKLVKVSKTPGCTRAINFFSVNNRLHFVDLPGYGFAQVSKKEQKQWGERIQEYLEARSMLRVVVLLLDPRRVITESDQNMIHYLQNIAIPYLPVATKIDKLRSNARRDALNKMTTIFSQPGSLATTTPLPCSSLNGQGIAELWGHLGPMLE